MLFFSSKAKKERFGIPSKGLKRTDMTVILTSDIDLQKSP
jgi:hypothetical protein